MHRGLHVGRDEMVGARRCAASAAVRLRAFRRADRRSRPRNSRRWRRCRCVPPSYKPAVRQGSSRPPRPCRPPTRSRAARIVASMSRMPEILVELAHPAERRLKLIGNVGVELDPRLEPPEQIGRDRQIARLGELVAFAADAGIDPENLLDDDDRRARGRPPVRRYRRRRPRRRRTYRYGSSRSCSLSLLRHALAGHIGASVQREGWR